jgi:hypothetical protein
MVMIIRVFLLAGMATGLPGIVKIGRNDCFSSCNHSFSDILGGLFDVSGQRNGHGKQETAFRYAVERINNNKTLLNKTILSAQIEKIPPRDSFHTHKRGQ